MKAIPRYREPLARDAQRLAKKLSAECEVVLLGSIATGKYVDVLLENFQHRLRFPADFVGRGDMSRGGLLLRCAVDKTELTLHFGGGRCSQRQATTETDAAAVFKGFADMIVLVSREDGEESRQFRLPSPNLACVFRHLR